MMMKARFLLTVGAAAGIFLPEMGWSQGAVHTDTAGNPVTSLNLGAGTVTGTLAPERLPAAARPPVVQTISQTSGDLTLGPGTNVAVLGGALTGALHLTLPAAGSYPPGRALVIADPGGYSSENWPVTVTPPTGNKLNEVTGGTVVALSGVGAASLRPDGSSRWITGESRWVVPTSNGMTVAGPANDFDGRLLTARNGDGLETISLRGEGTLQGINLDLEGTLYSDSYTIFSDGMGRLFANYVAATGYTFPFSTTSSGNIENRGETTLYLGTDLKLHCYTSDGVDHILTWSEP